jgi:3-methyladenine DNA glycosylase AlkD
MIINGESVSMKRLRKSGEADAIRSELKSVADPEKAIILMRFFKTGPGEYAEGDRFHGVVVPKIRCVVKARRCAPLGDVLDLLHSAYHEERLTALLILVEQYQRGDSSAKKEIYDLYLANTAYINNWDLVDLTSHHIVGHYLSGKDTSVLTHLARSGSLWERRIAMLSTFYFIRRGESEDALQIAEILLNDPHDLIHKAVGWMLREVGKRCSESIERRFLDKHAARMPRTMLRYAIEHFEENVRLRYLKR